MTKFHGRLTGRDYDSVEAMRHYEALEAMRQNAPSKEQLAVESMPLDELRKGIEQLAKSDQQKVAQLQAGVDLAAFLQAHPEYDDADDNANGSMMKFYLEGQGVDTRNGVINYYQLEDAFNGLKAAGFLKLKAGVVKQQREQAVTERVEEIKREQHFDHEEAYSLPMEELRMRAAGIR